MDYRWGSVGETGDGLDAERGLAESIRVKALEFEREREAYIEAARQQLLQDLSKTGMRGREDGRGVRSRLAGRGLEEDKENVGEINPNLVNGNPTTSAATATAAAKAGVEAGAAAVAAAAAVVAGAGAGPRQDGGKVRAAPSLRQAREERRAASEEIRVLQQRKADAAVRLQGEKLRHYATHARQRHPKVGIGVWQTLLRAPLVDNGQLPKDNAGRGLTSRLWPRNFDEEEPLLEAKRENDLRMSQARPGRDALRDRMSRTRPSLRSVK